MKTLSVGKNTHSILRLELTNQCNFKCSYCFCAEQISEKNGTYLETQKAKKLIDQASEMGVRRFILIGGEPLMHPDILDIISYITDKRGYSSLVTNGSLLMGNKGEQMIQDLAAAGLRYIAISLDGIEGHDPIRLGAVNHKLANVAIKAKKYLRTIIISVVNEHNIAHLDAMYNFAKANKLEWKINTHMQTPDSLEIGEQQSIQNYDNLFKAYQDLLKRHFNDGQIIGLDIGGIHHNYEKTALDMHEFTEVSHPCDYRKGTININPKGELTICPLLTKPLVNTDAYDHLSHACAKVESEEDFYSIRSGELSHCHQCKYFSLCGGGCRAHASLYQTQMSPDPMKCLTMPRWEKYILPLLPKDIQAAKKKLIHNNGKPPFYSGTKMPARHHHF